MLREGERAVGDAVHEVQRDSVELLAVEHDKVVLEDQEREVGDENQPLPLVVPVIHPEKQTPHLLISYSMSGFSSLTFDPLH